MSALTAPPDLPDEPPDHGEPVASAGPLGDLPSLSHRQLALERRLSDVSPSSLLGAGGLGLDALAGPDVAAGAADVLWRASGLRRPGAVAQLSWPRLGTRLAIGIETPLAHALVDRLLGYERLDVEGRLQLTPVEWGIVAFLVARGISALDGRPGPLGAWDVVLDRAGPDPFDIQDLGAIVTVRWGVRVGRVAGSVRLWLPESLVSLWLAADPPPRLAAGLPARGAHAELASVWRAEAGLVDMPRGLGKLRAGGVLPLTGSRLHGTPQSPSGLVELTCPLSGRAGRVHFPAEPVPHSGGGLLTLSGPARRDDTPREALALNPATDPTTAASPVAPTDIPVTLTVELGRVNLTLSRLADLKPGDVVELGRHSREPVELTSNGRLVARGELVLIDTELGFRVTSVFL